MGEGKFKMTNIYHSEEMNKKEVILLGFIVPGASLGQNPSNCSIMCLCPSGHCVVHVLPGPVAVSGTVPGIVRLFVCALF